MHAHEHGGDVYTNAHVTLDFSVNLNPLGMPEAVKQALRENAGAYERYPDCECRRLRAEISRKENVPAENILCGNGAADLIYRLCFALKPKTALVTAPAFADYERAAALAGGKMIRHTLLEDEGFALTERFLADITENVDMAFLCSPNNPTGRLVPFGLLTKIAERCERTGTHLIVDECFIEFTEEKSVKELLADCGRLTVLRAFTKSYAMAGLRLGYMMTKNEETLRLAKEHAQPWSVSGPAQAAGIAALGDSGGLARMRELVTRERGFLQTSLRELGVKTYPGDANFLLLKTKEPLYGRLLRRGILVRSCANFAGLGDAFTRICVKTRAENEELLAAIKAICDKEMA